MSTTPRNPSGVELVAGIVPIAADAIISQGDRVTISSNLAVVNEDPTADWFGVADGTNPDAQGNGRTTLRVLGKGSVCRFKFETALETAAYGTPVYQLADEQAVSTSDDSAANKLVGYVVDLATVTAAAGVFVNVRIEPTQAGAFV